MSAVHGVEDDRTDEEFEALARAERWVPEDEYRGNGKWVDAKTFVLRGETIRPILRAKNAKQEEEINRLRGLVESQGRTITEQRGAIESATMLARRADERGYKRALAELEARRDDAIDEGNKTVALQTQAEIDAMKEERVAAPPPAPVAADPPANTNAPHPDVAAFIADNPWFNTDAAMRDSMLGNHRAIIAENPMMPLPQQLAMARKRVVAAFPARFGTPAAEPDLDDEEEEEEELAADPPARRPVRAAAVLPASRGTPPPRRNASPWMSIPEAGGEREKAQEAYRRMVNGGSDMSPTEYVTIYNDPSIDVIELRKRRPAA